MSSDRVLIKHGQVVLPSDGVEEAKVADILIENGIITRVENLIEEEADEVIDASGCVVSAGLIDTHRHNWQGVLRGALPNGDLPQYVDSILGGYGGAFEPEDVYASNLLGAASALDSGITTMLDWSHISNTPAHSDAAVESLVASGIRGVYAHGWPINDLDGWTGVENTRVHPEDIRRIAHAWASRERLTIAMAVRGPEFVSYEATAADVRLARELGIRMSVHIGGGAWGAQRAGVEHMNSDNLLGPDITFIHGNTCSDQALALIADSGGSISASPQIEMQMGHGPSSFARFERAGLVPSLSVDTECCVAGDMFGVMRSAFQGSRMEAHALVAEGTGASVPKVQDVLAWATIQGARACGLDDEIGSLDVGKRADIVIFDFRGPDTFPSASAVGSIVLYGSRQHVKHVLVDGKIVKRDGRLQSVDWPSVLVNAERAYNRILLRHPQTTTLG